MPRLAPFRLLSAGVAPLRKAAAATNLLAPLALDQACRNGGPLENPIGFVTRESPKRTQPSPCVHFRSDKQMHMIRHHHESMKLIPLKPILAVVQSLYYHLGDFRLAKE